MPPGTVTRTRFEPSYLALYRSGELDRRAEQAIPGGMAGTRDVIRFLAGEISPHSYVNIMTQYYPAGQVGPEKYSEINRRITAEEHQEAIRMAREEGLYRFDERHGIKLRLRVRQLRFN
ncbi:MAG: hypothetical protein V3U42_02210 [candidate division NC10 bacterium]|jgi:hypothetical protein|nr:hypothetical protein [candidate division NC10 bacterium]MCH7896341.1 hypothetical protein [candidate division NC10 bacterium]MCZ6550267.1 hypothetical protein [candidate division NC10 bacterium]